MFKQLTNLFKDELVKVKTVKRTISKLEDRKSLSKKQKVLNLLSKGDNVVFGLQFKVDLN